jgi:RNA polymerase sigma-70 factor (family 1)
MIALTTFSDQELMDLVQQGNQPAFAELYKRYWEKMVLIAWNGTNDKALAEDIVHEVFIALWNEKNNFQIINVGGFLATKIKFAVFKIYRKVQRRSKLAEMNYDFSEVSLDEEKLDALFLKEYIDQIVEHLPEKCKLVFKCSRQLGLKNSEIASQMNISEKSVEANLTRALKTIRNNLEITSLVIIVLHTLFQVYR